MSLDKPPPSRYRVEEKNGRLIVHDSQSGTVLGNQFAKQPPARTGAALDAPKTKGSALNLVARATSALNTMERAVSTPEASGPKITVDQERAKRGAIVAIVGIALAFFAIFSGLWIGVIIAFIVAPIRQAIIGRLFPAIKLYVAEGRWN